MAEQKVELVGRCARCAGTPEGCLCASLEVVPTRTRFLLLQHALEQGKVSNTGRIAALALPSLERRVYGARDALDLSDLNQPGTYLLFPGAVAGVEPSAVERVVVLDASWSQARRMVQRVAALRTLPRLSLTVSTPSPSLRRAPSGGVSTLQAISRCVELLEGAEPAAKLDALHALMVERVRLTRGYV